MSGLEASPWPSRLPVNFPWQKGGESGVSAPLRALPSAKFGGVSVLRHRQGDSSSNLSCFHPMSLPPTCFSVLDDLALANIGISKGNMEPPLSRPEG